MVNDGFVIQSDQSFGNCPKYIQARSWQWKEPILDNNSSPQISKSLSLSEQNLIKRSDTFFVASVALHDDDHDTKTSAFGADISHRGGKPGFMQVINDNTLMWPDYLGNFLFNTLGNIVKYKKCGLFFLDFETGDTLQLTGNVSLPKKKLLKYVFR